MNFPSRVFLDTCSINFILENGEQIFDGGQLRSSSNERERADIEAFRNIFIVGQRASWQIAVSPNSYHEVSCTKDDRKRRYLESWFYEIWNYWQNSLRGDDNLLPASNMQITSERRSITEILKIIPDPADRILICDAIKYKCDSFCTRDWKTILRYRGLMKCLKIEFITPFEWWSRLKPWAGIWA